MRLRGHRQGASRPGGRACRASVCGPRSVCARWLSPAPQLEGRADTHGVCQVCDCASGWASPRSRSVPLHRPTRCAGCLASPGCRCIRLWGWPCRASVQRTRRCGAMRTGCVGAVSSRSWSVSRVPGWCLPRPPPHATPAVSHGSSGSIRASRCGLVASRCRSWGSRSFRARSPPPPLLERSTSSPDRRCVAGASSARCMPFEAFPLLVDLHPMPRSRAASGVVARPHGSGRPTLQSGAVLPGLHGRAFPLVVSRVAASAFGLRPPCRVRAAGFCCRASRPQGFPPRADPLRLHRVAAMAAPDAPLGLPVLQLPPSRGLAARLPRGPARLRGLDGPEPPCRVRQRARRCGVRIRGGQGPLQRGLRASRSGSEEPSGPALPIGGAEDSGSSRQRAGETLAAPLGDIRPSGVGEPLCRTRANFPLP